MQGGVGRPSIGQGESRSFRRHVIGRRGRRGGLRGTKLVAEAILRRQDRGGRLNGNGPRRRNRGSQGWRSGVPSIATLRGQGNSHPHLSSAHTRGDAISDAGREFR